MCVSAHWSGVYPGPPSLDDKLGVRHKCWVGPGSDGSTRAIYALLLSLIVDSVPWTGKAAGKWILQNKIWVLILATPKLRVPLGMVTPDFSPCRGLDGVGA